MRVAVGQVQAGDPHAAYIRFQIARLLLVTLVRAGDAKPALHFGQCIARAGIDEDRDPVEALLTVPNCAVSDCLEIARREALVLRLDLLQAGDRGAGFFQPFDEARQPRLDAVDVEGGDFHARACAANDAAGLT